jgi:hypothetical protein
VQQDVQALLKSKNRCLSQLIVLTEDALRASSPGSGTAIESFLPSFDRDRSAIFRAIELVDREISRALPRTQPSPGPAERQGLKSLVEEQQQLILSLQSLDSRLLENFEAAIQAGQREIHQQLQSREKLARFKSQGQSASGEGLDQKL